MSLKPAKSPPPRYGTRMVEPVVFRPSRS
jgi:hypothetical protein